MFAPFASFRLESQAFEILYLPGDGTLGGQTLDA
jgi:hypothetical protein